MLSVKTFLGRPTWVEKMKARCCVPIYGSRSQCARGWCVEYVDANSPVLYHNEVQGVFIDHRQHGCYSPDKMEPIPKPYTRSL
jgi:hypothetical protein